MHTLPREQSGLPDTSFNEGTPLIEKILDESEKEYRINKEMAFITKRFPKADESKFGPTTTTTLLFV